MGLFDDIKHGFEYAASGGIMKDTVKGVTRAFAGDLVSNEVIADVNDTFDKAIDETARQNQKTLDGIKDAATWCASNPGECALQAADWVPVVGTAARCTQLLVQGVEHDVGEDTATNCIGNAVGDVVGLATGGSGKYLLKGSLKLAERETLTLAEREGAQGALNATEKEAQRKASAEAATAAARQRTLANGKALSKALASDTAMVAGMELTTAAIFNAVQDAPADADEHQKREEEAFFNANRTRTPTASAPPVTAAPPGLALPMLLGAGAILVVATAAFIY
jgi:uncharacterized protein YggL (DUF469 family)